MYGKELGFKLEIGVGVAHLLLQPKITGRCVLEGSNEINAGREERLEG
jgi:hypothetical protein